MSYKILDTINCSSDVSKLNIEVLGDLSKEIRLFLIDKVSKTGGHLSANLGTVEMEVAMHYCFTTPQDSFVFDVGHQSYTHKMLTGRKDGFDELRQKDGLSGFPNPLACQDDSFISGHGSTSISVAVGLAKAKKIKKEDGYVIAVVGDGAFTGGMIYEGLNNIDETLDNLIIILNDNKMSISKNVGAMSHYLAMLRTNSSYLNAKENVSDILKKLPIIGSGISKTMVSSKSLIRRALFQSTFFEDMGLVYHKVENGNDVEEMCAALNAAKRTGKATLIHAITTKGKGFTPAESNPGAFHGIGAFDKDNLPDPDEAPSDSYSTIFGKNLTEIAKNNKDVCAITAAMKYGTGLQFFYKEHKDRFFDVGMAEEHAVTFASALAKSGLQPVVCLYSTFMQRAMDQYIHDVMLMKTNVMFGIDRAGLVPADGETHQGVYDIGIFTSFPNTVIACPSNYEELKYWQEYLINNVNAAKVIRYPRGGQDKNTADYVCTKNEFDILSENSKTLVICYGRQFSQVLQAQADLKEKNINIDICKLNIVNPLSQQLVDIILAYDKVYFYEEHVKTGSVSNCLAEKLLKSSFKGEYITCCVDNSKLTQATVNQLWEIFNMDTNSIVKTISEGM